MSCQDFARANMLGCYSHTMCMLGFCVVPVYEHMYKITLGHTELYRDSYTKI